MPEPTVLLSGLGIPESPRWHEGRLWFCNWIDRQVVAVGMDGTAEVILARDPDSHSMGYSIDWLPDGRLLTTGDKIQRQEPDGSMAILAGQHANEIVVDGKGNTYINGADFDFAGGGAPKPGYIKLITPDGALRQVADGIQFPNGGSSPRTTARWSFPSRSPGGSPRSTSTPTEACPAGGSSLRASARMASAWTPKARCGPGPAGSGWPGSPRAATCCNVSNCPRARPRLQ